MKKWLMGLALCAFGAAASAQDLSPPGTGTSGLSPSLQALLPQLMQALQNNPELAAQAGAFAGLGGVPGLIPPSATATTPDAAQRPQRQRQSFFIDQPELKLIDADTDGIVDADEAAAYLEWEFRRRDLNGNGTLSSREFTAVEKLGPNDGNKARMRSESRRIAQFWPLADANKDGRVTRAEFMAMSEERYTQMDTNGDGKVSPFEYRGARLF
jgi:hypothetical protein